MCLANVYQDTESDKPILENVTHIIIDDNQVEVETLFGERKVFLGKVRQLDFVKSRVLLEKQPG